MRIVTNKYIYNQDTFAGVFSATGGATYSTGIMGNCSIAENSSPYGAVISGGRARVYIEKYLFLLYPPKIPP